MNVKTILIAGAIFLASGAQANIIVKASSNADTCANLAGLWTGGGKVSASFIECHYHGTVNATHTAGDHNYNMSVDLHKDDGICPDEEKLELPASCNNGVIVLRTDDANLDGSMNAAGNTIDLSGNVTFTVLGSRVKANVSNMRIQKQ